MVVGGGGEAYKQSEIYDLSGENQDCPSISDFSIPYGSVGTFINNKTLVCGGIDPSPGQYFSDCYSYNMQVSLTNIFLKLICYFYIIQNIFLHQKDTILSFSYLIIF